MSQCFRTVKEIWNTHSSCFVEPKALIALLHDLAARVGTASDELSYGENTAVWFEDGKKVLDYIQYDPRFRALSFKDILEKHGGIVGDDASVVPVSQIPSALRLEPSGDFPLLQSGFPLLRIICVQRRGVGSIDMQEFID